MSALLTLSLITSKQSGDSENYNITSHPSLSITFFPPLPAFFSVIRLMMAISGLFQNLMGKCVAPMPFEI